ncbi:hypothetical protein GE107_06480 [Cohnella sp. CFH 77786]|uniref:peptidylprolyl isomerase n=1 Tax=Cohnella sp. CFH 77786 TaxID=2662265 RepID=UPI001C60FDA6|nr:peptidyl-prolyl cis-trans isomerase [Cohnella sp. CFH 77786]MBW5445711.1 hypothetical protein [Cohnella sp. CFH 77786]
MERAGGFFTEDERRRRYEELKEHFYRNPDEITFLTVTALFAEDGGAARENRETAKAAIERIRQRIAAGEPYEEVAALLAKEEPGKWLVRERTFLENENRGEAYMGPSLLREAVKLPVGQISEIVEEEQGYSLLKTIERIDRGYIPYVEARDDVERRMIDAAYETEVRRRMGVMRLEILRDVYDQAEM